MSSCYDIIANDFSKTRAYVWNCVKQFIDNIHLDASTTIMEVGCGNGKNLDYLSKHGFTKDAIHSLDSCQVFVNMVRNKGYNCSLELAQNIDILYPSNYFDYLLCIAVIHHLPTEEERIDTITKCITLLKKGGHALFTTWAFEQSFTDSCGTVFTTSKPRTFPNAGDNIVSWNKNKIDDGAINQINHKNKKVVADRYYYIYTYEKWCLLWENVKSRLQMIDNNLDIRITIGYEEQNWVANVSSTN
jgi:2-polyprenyl-3-methyl-5-hydroxy-6-metoxy-1,4-benzoquinol methylase